MRTPEGLEESIYSIGSAGNLTSADVLLMLRMPYRQSGDGVFDFVACSKSRCALILPEVVREIARIKELSADAAEQVIYQNTVRVFGLTTQSESI